MGGGGDHARDCVTKYSSNQFHGIFVIGLAVQFASSYLFIPTAPLLKKEGYIISTA
ncbi:MAG: hypothetical protein RLY97_1756 [Pseudomonadota bacterium]